MQWYKNKILIGLLTGVLITLLTSVTVFTNVSTSLHNRFSNLMYKNHVPSNDIVIIGIDNKTLDGNFTNGQNVPRFADWSRSMYSKVLKMVPVQEVKAIAFDIEFDQKEKGIKLDGVNELLESISSNLDEPNKLIDSIRKYDPAKTHPVDEEFGHILGEFRSVILAKTALDTSSFNKTGLLSYANAIKPILILDPNESHSAFINIFPDPDDVIRRVPPALLSEIDGKLYESFAFKAVRLFYGDTPQQKGTLTADKYTMELPQGNLEIPLEDGQMLINYFAPPYGQNMVSFIDVLNGQVPPETFKDKIVLIGVTTPAIPDYAPVPNGDGVPMAGVEIHANIIQTLLDQKFLVNQSNLSQIIMIFLLSLVTAISVNYLSVWLGIILVLLLSAGHVQAAHFMYDRGVILQMVNPHIALLLTYISSVIYRYFAEVKQNQVIKGAFSHYVNPNVVEELLKHPEKLKLGGEKREVTVFFSDIENFTNVSEKLTAEALVELINEYMDAMSKVILKHGGTLDKFEGDAIMAFFNAPLDQPDHALQAAETVLGCRQELKSLHQKWQQEGKPLLNFRVGLATGEAIVGNMGSESRFDYTAMGDTINSGSRLESANKTYGTHVMVNKACASALQERFVLRELDFLRVKGKDQPIQVYELLARKGELPQSGLDLITAFEQGLKEYRIKNFEKALEHFKKAQEIFPQDQPTLLYIKRCRQFQISPPSENWDGVYTMSTK